MRSTVEYCPRCERRINYHLRSDGSCPGCNADLSHTEPPTREEMEEEKGVVKDE